MHSTTFNSSYIIMYPIKKHAPQYLSILPLVSNHLLSPDRSQWHRGPRVIFIPIFLVRKYRLTRHECITAYWLRLNHRSNFSNRKFIIKLIFTILQKRKEKQKFWQERDTRVKEVTENSDYTTQKNIVTGVSHCVHLLIILIAHWLVTSTNFFQYMQFWFIKLASTKNERIIARNDKSVGLFQNYPVKFVI